MEMEIRVEKSRIYKDIMSGKRVSGGAARGVSFLLRETSMVGGVKRSGHMFFSLKPHQQRGQWAAPPPLHSPLRVHKTFLLSKQKQKNIQLISQNMGFRVVQGALIYISVELNIIKSGHRNTVHIVGIVFEERTYIGRKFEVRIQYLSGLKHTYIAHNIKIFPTRIWYFAQILTNLHTNLSPLTKSQLYLSCLTKYREILQRLQIIKQVVRDQSSVLFCSFLM